MMMINMLLFLLAMMTVSFYNVTVADSLWSVTKSFCFCFFFFFFYKQKTLTLWKSNKKKKIIIIITKTITTIIVYCLLYTIKYYFHVNFKCLQQWNELFHTLSCIQNHFFKCLTVDWQKQKSVFKLFYMHSSMHAYVCVCLHVCVFG